MREKIAAFEYFISKLYEWNNNISEINITRIQKLLFLTSIINSYPDKHSVLLDDIFNNFHLHSLGYYEKDISDYINSHNGMLPNIKIYKDYFILLSIRNIINNIDPVIKKEIDISIQLLKDRNFDLINYSPYRLVNLCLLYYSALLNLENGNFTHIEPSILKQDDKIFKLTI